MRTARVTLLVLIVVALAITMIPRWPRDAYPFPPPADPYPADRTSPLGSAAIRGRVIDGETGKPLARAVVTLDAPYYSPSTMTTGDGAFAFTGLPARHYSLRVSKPAYRTITYPGEPGTTLRTVTGFDVTDGQALEPVTLALHRSSAIAGRLVDPHGEIVEGAAVTATRVPGESRRAMWSQAERSNDAGEFRLAHLQPGRYLLRVTPPYGHLDAPFALVPTYYPGVIDERQATPITVTRGQTIDHVDLTVIERPMVSVSGSVLTDQGRPAHVGEIWVERPDSRGNPTANATIRADGSFALRLPAGDYQFKATVSGPSAVETGVEAVTVMNTPLTGLVIRAGTGSTISGRIRFIGAGPTPAASDTFVSAYPRAARILDTYFHDGDNCTAANMTVHPDLTFTIEGAQGQCLISARTRDGGWVARSSRARGADLLDRTIDLQHNEPVNDVQIVLTNRRIGLNATVTDERGKPSDGHVLVLFTTDPARQATARFVEFVVQGPTARQRLSGRSVTTLRSGLPPGDWYVIAIDDAVPADLRDPAYLARLAPLATRVTLREDDVATIALRRVKVFESTR